VLCVCMCSAVSALVGGAHTLGTRVSVAAACRLSSSSVWASLVAVQAQ